MKYKIMAYHLPNSDVLQLIGEIVIIHEHLNHELKMLPKLVNINSVEETVRLAGFKGDKKLHEIALRKPNELSDSEFREKIGSYIERAEKLTEYRNNLVHGLWVQVDGELPSIKNIKGLDRSIPSLNELQKKCSELDLLMAEMNRFRLEYMNV